MAVSVMQSLTGSSRYHSSINMYVYKPKYSSVFAHFGGVSPLILKLDIRWSSVVSFMPRLLFLVENPPAMRLMGGEVGRRTSLVAFEGEKKLLSLL